MKNKKGADMDNLIKKLQEEVGLTEEQAIKTMITVKHFMDQEEMHIDWGKFFDHKVDKYSDKIKNLLGQLVDKADGMMDKAKDSVKDIGTKTGHFFG